MQFPKISIGRSSKRYTHNMSFDNNTTLPFGVVQPLLSQRLDANSKISVNMRQLVRLAPMPVPTFARIFMNNEVSFVPTVDVCPYYEALLTQMSYKGSSSSYYPTQLPSTSNSFLLYHLLTNPSYARYSIFDGNGTLLPMISGSVPSKYSNELYHGLYNISSGSPTIPLLPSGQLYSTDDFISVDGADFVFQAYPGDASQRFTITFKFTDKGKRLRNVLIGLGYSLASDTSRVSIIPLLSFYKAWFDLYYPYRDISWLDTKCFQLIRLIEDYTWDFGKQVNSDNHSSDFLSVLDEISDCFFISKDDILSVHRTSMNISGPHNFPTNFVDFGGRLLSTSQVINSKTGTLPFIDPSDNGEPFGLITLQALQRFTRYFNKNSVIGRRISKYLQVHYGASVANSLFKDSNHVHSFSYPLNIDDIFSQSDTFQVNSDFSSSGDVLGSYAGKGLGFDKSHFEFTAPTDGYIFVLSSLSTPTGYFQGNSGDLYVTDFDTVPSPDFDALGYESSPRGQFFDTNSLAFNDLSSDVNPKLNASFGFVPRYTGLKYHKNIVNGDISRRGTSSSLSAYHLNRIITPYTLEQTSLDTSSRPIVKTSFLHGTIPNASSTWRFLSAHEWLGNYDRIFYNSSELFPHGYHPLYAHDDNFIIQTVFDSKVTNLLKPLSQSFDTYEESTDDSSVDVNPE